MIIGYQRKGSNAYMIFFIDYYSLRVENIKKMHGNSYTKRRARLPLMVTGNGEGDRNTMIHTLWSFLY